MTAPIVEGIFLNNTEITLSPYRPKNEVNSKFMFIVPLAFKESISPKILSIYTSLIFFYYNGNSFLKIYDIILKEVPHEKDY
jgi:hypothetical protein